MQKYVALLLLTLAVLACSLPFSGSPAETPNTPTPDLSTLVAESLTSVAATTASTTVPPPETPAAPAESLKLNIVYAKNGNIVLWREGAETVLLTNSGKDQSPRISSDGQRIAFIRDGELYSIRPDGSDERLLVSKVYLSSFSTPDFLAVSLVQVGFVPATRHLMFSLMGETEVYPVPLGDLQRVDSESGLINTLLAPGNGGGKWTFSPDGQYYSLSQGDKIRIFRSDGVESRPAFSFPFVSTYSEWVYTPEVVWRSDSAGFYTVIPASAALDNPAEKSRFYYVPIVGEPAKLAEFLAVPVWQSFPYISPDGIKVAYIQESGGSQSLHVIDASTADRVYASGSGMNILNWNPDSVQVAYRSGEPATTSLAAYGAEPIALIGVSSYSYGMKWITPSRYIHLNREELYLGDLSGSSLLVDNAVTDFDFALIP